MLPIWISESLCLCRSAGWPGRSFEAANLWKRCELSWRVNFDTRAVLKLAKMQCTADLMASSLRPKLQCPAFTSSCKQKCRRSASIAGVRQLQTGRVSFCAPEALSIPDGARFCFVIHVNRAEDYEVLLIRVMRLQEAKRVPSKGHLCE